MRACSIALLLRSASSSKCCSSERLNFPTGDPSILIRNIASRNVRAENCDRDPSILCLYLFRYDIKARGTKSDVADALPIIVVIAKTAGMLLLIGGGVLALIKGYELFKDGAGHGHESLVLQIKGVTVSARSVGSVVMATAAVWAWAGAHISPNFERSKDTLKIYSFENSGAIVEAPELATTWTARQLGRWDKNELHTHVNALLKNDKAAWVRVNDIQGYFRDAKVNADSNEITLEVGMPLFDLAAGAHVPPKASVVYSPAVQGMHVVLRPTAANVTPK